ncbi:MAG: prolyl oligopeptidase family serine peptidase [Hoylesella buccalis]
MHTSGSHRQLAGQESKQEHRTRVQYRPAGEPCVAQSLHLLLSDDDTVVLPANGVNYYLELYRHDVPASLHVYPSGDHGFGYNRFVPLSRGDAARVARHGCAVSDTKTVPLRTSLTCIIQQHLHEKEGGGDP